MVVTDSAWRPKGHFKDLPLYFLKVWYLYSFAFMGSEKSSEVWEKSNCGQMLSVILNSLLLYGIFLFTCAEQQPSLRSPSYWTPFDHSPCLFYWNQSRWGCLLLSFIFIASPPNLLYICASTICHNYSFVIKWVLLFVA